MAAVVNWLTIDCHFLWCVDLDRRAQPQSSDLHHVVDQIHFCILALLKFSSHLLHTMQGCLHVYIYVASTPV